MQIFERTKMLLGEDNMKKLKNSKVAVFGIGGVGSYTAMALARSGICNIDIIDNDVVSISNINRQLVATTKTVGRYKTDVMKEMILDINENANVTEYKVFLDKDTINEFNLSEYDYVVDAIDTVSSKILLAEICYFNDIKIISSMGAGNKLNPAEFEVEDIYKTSVCPLARVMRYELKKRNVKKLKVVYSKEKPIIPAGWEENDERKKVPGSTAFVPSVAGLIMASEVVKELIK